jgi:hypothetical protein
MFFCVKEPLQTIKSDTKSFRPRPVTLMVLEVLLRLIKALDNIRAVNSMATEMINECRYGFIETALV